MRRFEDKMALVTGAASGIGAATALRIADEGGSVACMDIDLEGAAATAAAVEERGVGSMALRCDVGNADEVDATVNAAVEGFGKLDVLCNIAGILRADHSHELSLENWDNILRVNLTGTFLMCRAAIPHLLAQKGAIVNMSSTAALGSHPWMAAYAASKGGILSLTRCLSVEYIKQGLRVNAACPGGINTPLHSQFSFPDGADPQLLKGAIPHMSYAGPEAVAALVAFLASADASYIHGTELRVDGGALS
jgi:NAD(P)-dependent dehydrogenase (short-subunit alcohol dehydrogenase family)